LPVKILFLFLPLPLLLPLFRSRVLAIAGDENVKDGE
jgi:hypothetical protein